MIFSLNQLANKIFLSAPISTTATEKNVKKCRGRDLNSVLMAK
jgi:hypothetical protein